MQAVPIEPFSTTNSLLTGKLTGKFDESRRRLGPLERCKPGFRAFDDAFSNSGTGNLCRRNREFPGSNREKRPFLVSVQFSHACGGLTDCDLTSTARNAEEDSSVEMAGGLSV